MKKSAWRVLLVGALVVGMASMGAAELKVFDGFEDGDYTSDPQWLTNTNSGTVSVQNSIVGAGDYSLKLETQGSVSYDYVGVYNTIFDGSQLASGDRFQFRFRISQDKGNRKYSFNEISDTNYIQLQIFGNGISVDTPSSSGTINSSLETGSWYRQVIEYNSDSDWSFYLYDDTGTQVSSVTNFDPGVDVSKLQRVVLKNQDRSSSPVAFYFDDVSYSMESANDAPKFNSTDVTPDPPLIGENVSYGAEVYDPDGSIDYTNLTVSYGGSTVVSDAQRTGTTPSWNDIYEPSDGKKWLNATLETVDDAGAVTTQSINRYLTDTKPNVTINTPDSSIKNSNSISWNISTEEKDSKPNEALDLKIYKNGNLENTYSITEGENKTGSLNYNDGTGQTFKAEVVESDGDSDSETVTFDVDTTPPQINIDAPTGDLDKKKNLDLNFTVSDPHLDSSTCQYSKDGGAKFSISNCDNTTVTYNTIGGHNLTVYAEDTLGQEGSTTTEFTTDYENRISLEDSISSASIQEFEVTFKNDSTTKGGSTTDGQFEILTSELPTGSVEMTLKADGYKIKNQSLTVDDSFELRNTYQMDRASFTIDAKSEIQQNDLNFNFTASNSTTSFTREDISSFEEDYQNYDSIGFPTGDVKIMVQDAKGEHYRRTYYADIDENSVISLTSYLLEKGEGILTNVEIRDPQNEDLENALISIQRNINNNYKSVTQGKSASDGSASFYLSPDISYKVLASGQEYDSFEGTFNPANYQYDPLVIRLSEENNFTDSTTWDQVEYKLEPDIDNLNKTGEYTFNWTVSDPTGGITELGLRLKNSSGNVLDKSSLTGSPSGGTSSITFNLSNADLEEGELNVNGYFVKDSKEFNYERNYNVFERVEAGIYSIKSLMNDFEGQSDKTTRSFVALIFTLAISTGLKSRFNRKGGGIISLIILGVFTFTGWFNSYFWILTALALVGLYGRRG